MGSPLPPAGFLVLGLINGYVENPTCDNSEDSVYAQTTKDDKNNHSGSKPRLDPQMQNALRLGGTMCNEIIM